MSESLVEQSKETIVEITEFELNNLRNEISFLRCLEAAGVDNWEGYEDAIALWRAGDA